MMCRVDVYDGILQPSFMMWFKIHKANMVDATYEKWTSQ